MRALLCSAPDILLGCFQLQKDSYLFQGSRSVKLQYCVVRFQMMQVTMDAQALHMCSECLLLLEECPDLVAVQEMNESIEVRMVKL